MPVCVGDDALPIEHASRPSISIRTRLQRRGLAREDGSPRAPARARRRRGRARAERARPEARPRRGPPDRAASRRPGSPRRRDQANGCRNAEAAAHRTVCLAVAPELALTAARSPECWCMVASVSPLALCLQCIHAAGGAVSAFPSPAWCDLAVWAHVAAVDEGDWVFGVFGFSVLNSFLPHVLFVRPPLL